MRIVARVAIAVVVLAVAFLYLVGTGRFGRLVHAGSPTAAARPAAVVTARIEAQQASARGVGARDDDGQIVFGDLHVHTGFSNDAFLLGLPGMVGEGASTVSDACDFARFCSALDFFSINDHAEASTPRKWRETIDAIRQCDAVARAGDAPDLVPFLGWEWTQMGTSRENHFGHRNVVLRDLDDASIPARPISASSPANFFERARPGPLQVGLFPFVAGWEYNDLIAFNREVAATPACPSDVPERELPLDCRESAADPAELFAKLDDWNVPSLVVPHGTTWGMYTPQGASWDKQVAAHFRDPSRQRLVEVYSGHGNSEELRRWKEVDLDADGRASCPEATPDYLPGCQRAGELVRARCIEAGETDAVCDERAADARRYYAEAGSAAGHLAVPGARPDEWLDAGQCRDCFQPAFNYRPRGSVQYMLALRDFEGGDAHGGLDRFRFGFIGSSDTHTARAGTGYKEVARLRMTDAAMQASTKRLARPSTERPPEARPVDLATANPVSWLEGERSGSFFVTGGLAAVHARSRERGDVFDAMMRRETYATSGPRILLWFDLVNAPDAGARVPMGGHVAMGRAPRFEVRAVGSFEQAPGCPEHVLADLGADRALRLCANECYNPTDVRRPITRIEVVRIRPQQRPGEDPTALVEDPWRVLPCDGDAAGCRVRFGDPEFASAARDALYYVRAIEAPSPVVDAGGLRCDVDEAGRCTGVHACGMDPADDCLAPSEQRAWSSPIYVDYAAPPPWPTSDAPDEVL